MKALEAFNRDPQGSERGRQGEATSQSATVSGHCEVPKTRPFYYRDMEEDGGQVFKALREKKRGKKKPYNPAIVVEFKINFQS